MDWRGVGLKGITLYSSWLVQQLEFLMGFSSLFVCAGKAYQFLLRGIGSLPKETKPFQHMNTMEPWKLVGPAAPVLQFVADRT